MSLRTRTKPRDAGKTRACGHGARTGTAQDSCSMGPDIWSALNVESPNTDESPTQPVMGRCCRQVGKINSGRAFHLGLSRDLTRDA